MNIPIIIPAYEPDERMLELLRNIRQDGVNNKIIVVNDGSGQEYDYLYDAAEEYDCIVLRNFVNMGKGRALKYAFNYCLVNCDNLLGVVTADSDGQHSVADIKKCINALIESPNSLVLGCRNFDGDDVPAKSKFGNKLTQKICKLLCGINISDTQTGLRGIPKSFMAELLNVEGERFEFETRMLIESKTKYVIKEIGIQTIYDSKENHKTHFDPIRDSIRIYKIFGSMLIKFIFSSLSSCVVDLLLFHVFSNILRGKISTYIIMATVGARIISATYNFLLNHRFVFKSEENYQKSAYKYALLACVQMICSAGFVTIGCQMFSFIPEILVKVIVDTILFMISYVVQREIVFKK